MRIITRLPYDSKHGSIAASAVSEKIRPYQIIVQVSLNLHTIADWDRRLPIFPAILDTGYNHNLSLKHSHLVQWSGLQPNALHRLGTISERKIRIPLHAATLWLYCNIPGKLDNAKADPQQLVVPEGIAIYPDEIGPRLPILGLRALTRNDIHLTIDGARRIVNLRTKDWTTSVLNWIGG